MKAWKWLGVDPNAPVDRVLDALVRKRLWAEDRAHLHYLRDEAKWIRGHCAELTEALLRDPDACSTLLERDIPSRFQQQTSSRGPNPGQTRVLACGNGAAPDACANEAGGPPDELYDIMELIKFGKAHGFITFEQMSEVIPERTISNGLDDLLIMFSSMDIEVVFERPRPPRARDPGHPPRKSSTPAPTGEGTEGLRPRGPRRKRSSETRTTPAETPTTAPPPKSPRPRR